MALGSAGAAYLLGGLPPNIYAQAHSGDPGALGTANVVAGVSRAQVRSVANPGVISGSQWTMGGTASLLGIPAGATVSHLSLWDQASGGGFIDGATCTARTFVGAGTYVVDSMVLTASEGVATAALTEGRTDSAIGGDVAASAAAATDKGADAGTQKDAVADQRGFGEVRAEAGSQKDATANQAGLQGAATDAAVAQDKESDSWAGTHAALNDSPAEVASQKDAASAAIASTAAMADAASQKDATSDVRAGTSAVADAAVSKELESDSVMVADTTRPTVNSFTVGTPVGAVVPITAFTYGDNVGVTGFLVNESANVPSAAAVNLGSAPSSYTAVGSGNITLYPWVRDAQGNVSLAFSTPPTVFIDVTAPVAGTFSVPFGSIDGIGGINPGTCTDAVGIVGWMIKDGASASIASPVATDTGWNTISSTTSWAPGATLSFTPTAVQVSRVFRLFLKDAAGNVGASGYAYATVTAADVQVPGVIAFGVTNGVMGADGTLPGINLQASDNNAVVAWKIVEQTVDTGWPTVTTASPGTGWTNFPIPAPSVIIYDFYKSTLPTVYGRHYFRIWLKDSAGLVGNGVGTYADLTAGQVPTMGTLSVAGGANGGTFSVSAGDNAGITKYLLSEGGSGLTAADPGQTGATSISPTTPLTLTNVAFASTATATGPRYFCFHVWDAQNNHAASNVVGPITITYSASVPIVIANPGFESAIGTLATWLPEFTTSNGGSYGEGSAAARWSTNPIAGTYSGRIAAQGGFNYDDEVDTTATASLSVKILKSAFTPGGLGPYTRRIDNNANAVLSWVQVDVYNSSDVMIGTVNHALDGTAIPVADDAALATGGLAAVSYAIVKFAVMASGADSVIIIVLDSFQQG